MKKTIDKVQFLINLLGIGMSFAAVIISYGESFLREYRFWFSPGDEYTKTLIDKIHACEFIFLQTIFDAFAVVLYLPVTILLISVLLIFRQRTESVAGAVLTIILLFAMGVISFLFREALYYSFAGNITFIVAGCMQIACGIAQIVCYVIKKKKLS